MQEKKIKIYCILLLIAVAGLTSFFIHRAGKLQFDYNFENYFPVNDPDPEFFYDFRDTFGSENDFLFIAIENSTGIFQKKFLRKVKSLSDSLAGLRFVEMVQSPVNFKSPVITEMGLFEIPFLHIEEPEKYAADSARIYKTEWLVNSFFSSDAKALAVVVRNKGMLAKNKSDTLLFAIERLLAEHDFDNYHLAGRIHAQHHFLKKMEKEIFLFFFASLALVIVLLFVTFRNAWGIAFPVIAVLTSIAWLFGLMNITGKSLDLMSSLIPTIIFVVGMSDVIHIISKYLEEIKNGKEKKEAIKTTVKEIGVSTFLTSFTTAIGFLTLLSSGIIPIRQFGLYSSLGVCIAFAAAYLVLPPLLLLMKKPEIKKIPHKSWDKMLHRSLFKIIRHRKYIIPGFLLVFIISLFGIKNINVNNFLLEDLSDKDEFKKEYLYFENKFSGARPFEMGLWLSDSSKSFFDFDVLQQLEKIEIFLKEDYGVGFIVSPLTLVKSANQALNGGHPGEYRMPGSEEQLNKVKKILKRVAGREEIKLVLTGDKRFCRISGKIPDYGGYAIKNKNADLDSFMKKNTDVSLVDYKITGTAALIDKNNELLAENMIRGLLLAVFAVALIFGFIYGSLKIMIIALMTNILPLVMIGGLMGFSGIDLKISTSIVFTIAFGISVDDTIHFLSRMKLEMRKGRSRIYAMKRTYISTGKALVLTTFILSGGFLTLILSGFAGSYYIGLLVSLALVFALAADMILLPALLMLFYRKKTKAGGI